MIFWLTACTTRWLPNSPPGNGEDSGTEVIPVIETAEVTGDTGTTTETTPTSWDGIYPLVPYDCAQGVPPGPFQASPVADVLTTEDFVFAPDGDLVSSDWERNLMRFTSAGDMSVFVPDAAETRGLDVLPDGRLVVTDETTNQIIAVSEDGILTPLTNAGSSPSGIDVAADGTLYVGDISTGGVYEITPDGYARDLGPLAPGGLYQTYGVALSIDEQTLYVGQYNGNAVYRLQRDVSGAWGEPEPFATVDGFGLAGMAIDACDNLYVAAAIGCKVFRVTPAGDTELIASLDVPGDYCPSVGFGRDVGGWDPLALYVSTYATLAVLPVVVPGKPR